MGTERQSVLNVVQWIVTCEINAMFFFINKLMTNRKKTIEKDQSWE